ncbi:MAG TPA: hypothetical protein VOA87_16185 [Thermoanaerobaculia bacterium]|nr:hypothetical protein [Thermoanaerobaculia bacterium]
MPSLPDSSSPPPPPIDLTKVTEATRRQLYDAIVAIHFEPWTAEEIAEAKSKDDFCLDYTAEDAGVQVVYIFGRWFTWWRDLSADDDFPDSMKWEVLSIDKDATAPYGVDFSEV